MPGFLVVLQTSFADESAIYRVRNSARIGKRVAGLHQSQAHMSADFNDSLDESAWLGEH